MCVQEATTLYTTLRTITEYFEASVKNKEILDASMQILDMNALHLISWGQTRMGHFLKACYIFNKMLPAVYDSMYTTAIRIEERDLLFTAEMIYILKVLADLIVANFGKLKCGRFPRH